MSKHKSLVNPDYFKLRGREPQAGDVIPQLNRQQYAEVRAREKRAEIRPAPRGGGAQPVGEEKTGVSQGAAAVMAREKAPGEEAHVTAVAPSTVHEKRTDPHDAAQDLEVEDELITEGRQTSVKMGKRSSARKMARARHKAGPIPATSPVPGAFGRSGKEAAEE